MRLDFLVSGLTAAQVFVDFGAPAGAAEALQGDALTAPSGPQDLAFEEMDGLSGRLAFASAAKEGGALFAAATAWLGEMRVAALVASTLLFGMVCPGLHSIYGGLTLEAREDDGLEERLGFRVVATDPRFRLVRLAVAGGGLSGALETFARRPPAAQAAMRDLAGLVAPDEFAGAVALVVGGSRGLGEATAKLLAAGGAKVIVTYRVGAQEAEEVARDIRATGAICETLPYDAGKPAGPQLEGLGEAPTHAYYFATPMIFRAQSALFARERLDALLSVYADGFYHLARGLKARRGDVSLFYPSTVYVESRPRGMLEYAMAKAAGETLCAEMNEAWAPLRVTVGRLPRLPTDQTLSVMESDPTSPLTALLPWVRKTQSWPRRLETPTAG